MNSKNISLFFVYISFFFLFIYLFSPYLWLITAPFLDDAYIDVRIPFSPTLKHFKSALSGETLYWILNSLYISITTTFLSILVAIPGGYVLSRSRFKGKATVMYTIILTRIIPITLLIVPIYSMMLILKLMDTHSSLILIFIGIVTPLNLWIMKGTIDSIPIELEEAAEIEGATKYKTIYYVIIPLIKPGLGAVSVLSFSAAWADFLLPLILLNTDKNYTISIGIFTAFGFFEEIDYSLLATMCIIYMLPILIVYFMLSSSFSEGFGSIGTTEK